MLLAIQRPAALRARVSGHRHRAAISAQHPPGCSAGSAAVAGGVRGQRPDRAGACPGAADQQGTWQDGLHRGRFARPRKAQARQTEQATFRGHGEVARPTSAISLSTAKIILAAQHVVVDTRRVRDVDANAKLGPPVLLFLSVLVFLSSHRKSSCNGSLASTSKAAAIQATALTRFPVSGMREPGARRARRSCHRGRSGRHGCLPRRHGPRGGRR